MRFMFSSVTILGCCNLPHGNCWCMLIRFSNSVITICCLINLYLWLFTNGKTLHFLCRCSTYIVQSFQIEFVYSEKSGKSFNWFPGENETRIFVLKFDVSYLISNINLFFIYSMERALNLFKHGVHNLNCELNGLCTEIFSSIDPEISRIFWNFECLKRKKLFTKTQFFSTTSVKINSTILNVFQFNHKWKQIRCVVDFQFYVSINKNKPNQITFRCLCHEDLFFVVKSFCCLLSQCYPTNRVYANEQKKFYIT